MLKVYIQFSTWQATLRILTLVLTRKGSQPSSTSVSRKKQAKQSTNSAPSCLLWGERRLPSGSEVTVLSSCAKGSESGLARCPPCDSKLRTSRLTSSGFSHRPLPFCDPPRYKTVLTLCPWFHLHVRKDACPFSSADYSLIEDDDFVTGQQSSLRVPGWRSAQQPGFRFPPYTRHFGDWNYSEHTMSREEPHDARTQPWTNILRSEPTHPSAERASVAPSPSLAGTWAPALAAEVTMANG